MKTASATLSTRNSLAGTVPTDPPTVMFSERTVDRAVSIHWEICFAEMEERASAREHGDEEQDEAEERMHRGGERRRGREEHDWLWA